MAFKFFQLVSKMYRKSMENGVWKCAGTLMKV